MRESGRSRGFALSTADAAVKVRKGARKSAHFSDFFADFAIPAALAPSSIFPGRRLLPVRNSMKDATYFVWHGLFIRESNHALHLVRRSHGSRRER
jgi:hypothetical protein